MNEWTTDRIWGDCGQVVGMASAKDLRQSVPGVFKGTARRPLWLWLCELRLRWEARMGAGDKVRGNVLKMLCSNAKCC